MTDQSLHDILLRAEWRASIDASKNPLNRYGAKGFSQSDEDGLTLEILRRMDVKTGTFIEIGVGNGLENNTLVLLASGWRGFWISAKEIGFVFNIDPKRFAFLKAWVTLENIARLVRDGFDVIGPSETDVVSVDVDGNDFYFVRELLRLDIFPKLFIVEYNAKFLPPIKWSIEYAPDFKWDNSDYFGASLAAFDELFASHGYKLVCCNACTGINAFFIRDEFAALFPEVPKDIRDIHIEPRYQVPKRWGWQPSTRSVDRMLKEWRKSS